MSFSLIEVCHEHFFLLFFLWRSHPHFRIHRFRLVLRGWLRSLRSWHGIQWQCWYIWQQQSSLIDDLQQLRIDLSNNLQPLLASSNKGWWSYFQLFPRKRFPMEEPKWQIGGGGWGLAHSWWLDQWCWWDRKPWISSRKNVQMTLRQAAGLRKYPEITFSKMILERSILW